MRIEQLALSFISGIGPVTANLLLEKFGSAENFFQADPVSCRDAGLQERFCKDIGERRKAALLRAEKEMEACRKAHIGILSYEDPLFPPSLRTCADAPPVLYRIGDTDLTHSENIAVVGTRRASSYGKSQTRRIIESLAGNLAFTVSGLALGIDTEAHRSSIDCHVPTVAVLAHGLDKVYPEENIPLARRILETGGCLVSEMPLSTPISAGLFPRRNRIIAGLAQATLITESSMKGGAMRTAYAAESYQRMVFAIPGRNDSYYYEGCNHLIAKQKALLLQSAEDIRQALGWKNSDTDGKKKVKQTCKPDAEQQKILEILESENPAGWDFLLAKSGKEAKILAACLLKMEIAGQIRSLPGNFYEKT